VGWDALVFKLLDSRTLARELTAEKCAHLGGAAAVRAVIDLVLPNVDWSDPSWGAVDINGCSMEFNLRRIDKPAGDSLCFGIHVHGSGDPIPIVVALCRKNGWTPFDSQTGNFIDLTDPDGEGWKKFLAARDRYVNKLPKG
jgi:hypothetical protein